MFRIYLTNGSSYLLLPDIVYGRSLKEGGTYEEDYLNLLIEENYEILCFNALLKILRTRMHSTAELKKKLFFKKFKASTIDKTIKKAQESGVINDEVTAECYKNELLAKGYGPLKIKEAFIRKGFTREFIDNILSYENNDSEMEIENARKIFDKKLSFLQKDKSLQKHKIKEKLFRFMQSKGYSNDTIFSLMKDFSE